MLVGFQAGSPQFQLHAGTLSPFLKTSISKKIGHAGEGELQKGSV